MGVNQVKFGDTTVMDISDSTVAPETLLSGVTAYNKAGNKITGDMVVEHVEVEPVLETGTKSATITVGEESADIYCENTKTEVKNMKTTQSATITNGIAQFECIDKNFVKALKLAMEPIQDFNGYDYPWVGGAGKQLVNITDRDVTVSGVNIKVKDGVITINGTSTGAINYHLVDNMNFAENSYTFSLSGNLSGNDGMIAVQTSAGNKIASNAGNTFTASMTGFMWFFCAADKTFNNVVVKPMICLSTASEPTVFAPYENICPISGRTEVSVTRTAGEDEETKTHQYSETIYGGVDDFVNGGLINDKELILIDGQNKTVSFSQAISGYNRFVARYDSGKNPNYKGANSFCMCDKMIPDFSPIGGVRLGYSVWPHSSGVMLLFPSGDITNEAEANAWLQANPVTVCYELATPPTVETSAEEITALPGINVITGTEPISECSYRVLEENLSDTIYSNETLVGEDSDIYTLRAAPDISDANYVEENIVGGSVVFNQLVQNGNFTNTDNWSGLRGTLAAANGILTFTYTDVSARNVVYQTIPKIKSGHKYFMSCNYKPKYNHSMQMGVEFNGGSYITKTFSTIGSMWKKLTGIINGDANGQTTFSIIVRPSGGSYAANDTDQIKNVIFVDLTLMFGSSIADYVYNLENTTDGTGIAFLQRYGFLTKDYYDYNAGSLLSVNFNKWFKTSKNLFDPHGLHHIPNYDNIIDGNDVYIAMQKNTYACLHDVGSYIPGNGRTYTLQFDPPSDITWTYASVRCRLKDNSDFGNVGSISRWTYDAATKSYKQSFENASHVEVTGTIPDCLYCEFGIGYNDSFGNIKETGTYVKFSNIQLEVGSEATDYEPYEGYEISLDDNLDLRGLFRIVDNELVADGDIYEGDGKITRKYGVIDLGTLNWITEDSEISGLARVNSVQIEPLGIEWTSIPLCSSYDGVLHKGYNFFNYGEIGLSNSESAPQLRCRSEGFIGKTNEEIKSIMSGVILQYELAEPVLNRGTNFDSPQVFIPNGNEYFVKTYDSTPDRDIDIPAGHVGKYYGKSMFKEISLPTIPKSGGTYILKCNVLADGNKKLYWCADSD